MSDLVAVHGKTFGRGEVVWLDGKHFVGCRFDGCIVGYAATGDFRFTGSEVLKIAGVELDGLASTTVDVLLRSGVVDLKGFLRGR